ncbi:MAG: bifunctional nicotinamidase/pyrazinamidase [Treponema sp.]|jgi:nicotinamidase/pyrazinamidase|nr:bifunctional nicotinamidase/pyrazinamidase [Treponema sp.]
MHIDIKRACLLEIDVQNDFCPAYTSMPGGEIPAGALAVNKGDEVIAPLNALATAFAEAGGRVAASQDWHPCGHISFASSHAGRNVGELIELEAVKVQMLWPDHCVQGTRGAAFHEKLDLKPVSIVIRKGFRKGLDSYSAFFENDRKTPTGLEGWLKSLGVTQLIIGGLATDYCVFYSAMDALALGFQTIIASDAVRGVDYPAGSVEQAVETMKKSGVVFAESGELLVGMGK